MGQSAIDYRYLLTRCDDDASFPRLLIASDGHSSKLGMKLKGWKGLPLGCLLVSAAECGPRGAIIWRGKFSGPWGHPCKMALCHDAASGLELGTSKLQSWSGGLTYLWGTVLQTPFNHRLWMRWCKENCRVLGATSWNECVADDFRIPRLPSTSHEDDAVYQSWGQNVAHYLDFLLLVWGFLDLLWSCTHSCKDAH